ncbi:MAG: transcription-repair coupling factor [Chloroflexi bacterium]|nr:transcription-repair coupling factor [Chloroflexota bacterium]PKB56821.1 MAG: transcription-repair coupling factor [SAR202 cluster bacterium Casp-Chloro-G3]
MPLNGILSAVIRHPDFVRHFAQFDSSPDGLNESAGIAVRQGARPAYLAALWRHAHRPMLVLTPRPEDARRLHDQILTYVGDDELVYLLPEPEVLPFERLAVDARTSNQRLAALSALAGASTDKSGKEKPLVIASLSAAYRRILPPSLVSATGVSATGSGSDSRVSLKMGQRIPKLDELLTHWVNLGYRHEPLVESPGCFSQRGGIIDVFPPHYDLPVRIELWDDEIDTIRSFDPYTQRSIGEVESVFLIPAREQLPNLADRAAVDRQIAAMDLAGCTKEVKERIEEDLVDLFRDPDIETLHFYNGLLNSSNLLEYLPEDGLLVLDRWSQIEVEAQEQEEKYFRMRSSREERGELPRNFPAPYFSWDELAPLVNGWKGSRLHLQSWLTGDADSIFAPATPYFGQLGQFTADLRQSQQQGDAVVVVSQHSQGRITEILEQAEVGVAPSSGVENGEIPEPGHVYLVSGSVAEGWQISFNGSSAARSTLTLLSDAELFGTSKERRYRPSKLKHDTGKEVTLADLVPGSYVVHVDHGVARFAGTTRMGDDGEDREYLILEYADNDKLYVPTDQLDRVGAYVGSQEQQPNLTRLGTAEWSRIKDRVKGAAREIAQELLKLYAARQLAQGHQFTQDTVWQRELEDSFPYQETPDQAQAIDEVKLDMEQSKPMDRLICGDVGYGKTEVALRAAFKTVSEGMQVGLLVPTTVLAQQHYATFTERLSPFPLRVEVLSRFRTPKEQKSVVEGLHDGSVDIVIGTHRLLQKDVRFKNLGLVVVDEEQRFGVSHKERLKKLRGEVDVLTLTATPIPRTLHMALSGIRDMSVIHTPPEARLPVKTFVSEYSEDIIKEAILREMERGGQVFFLHNRVRTINQTAAELSELIPQARITVGHGQMPEADLEDVMVSFANQEADVLVCTTIIESGLDLPNVNTIIIDRADRFGLAQLYQLRGRVGRGEHRAYAYLLVPRGRRITSTAEQRIEAILEASELGSGFRIAMRDMEIRGAGNLLGAAQSGQIHSVGLTLYSQLLQEAVNQLMHEQGSEGPASGPVSADLPRIDVPLPSSIPDSYVSHLPTRLSLYQRFAQMTDRNEVKEIEEELRDRFGPLPEVVANLLSLVDLRALAAGLDIDSIVQSAEGITVGFRNSVGSARTPLQRALGPSVTVGNTQMTISKRELGDQWQSRLTRILERLQVFRDRLARVGV